MASYKDIEYSNNKYSNSLPSYLNGDERKSLQKMLNQFPNNIDKKFYSCNNSFGCVFLQGDVINNFDFADIKNSTFKKSAGLFLTNTCDASFENKRNRQVYICYCSIIKLESYEQMLRQSTMQDEEIATHLDSVKSQFVTNLFYLPPFGKYQNGLVALLDHICSDKLLNYDQQFIESEKLVSLSQYGYYIFLLKLSNHFLRLQEGKSRT